MQSDRLEAGLYPRVGVMPHTLPSTSSTGASEIGFQTLARPLPHAGLLRAGNRVPKRRWLCVQPQAGTPGHRQGDPVFCPFVTNYVPVSYLASLTPSLFSPWKQCPFHTFCGEDKGGLFVKSQVEP